MSPLYLCMHSTDEISLANLLVRAVDQVKFGESKAIWSSISDPYVAVLLEDRSICVYVASDANQRLEKITSTPIRGGTISTITLFYGTCPQERRALYFVLRQSNPDIN
jgi:hypothetical protein